GARPKGDDGPHQLVFDGFAWLRRGGLADGHQKIVAVGPTEGASPDAHGGTASTMLARASTTARPTRTRTTTSSPTVANDSSDPPFACAARTAAGRPAAAPASAAASAAVRARAASTVPAANRPSATSATAANATTATTRGTAWPRSPCPRRDRATAPPHGERLNRLPRQR